MIARKKLQWRDADENVDYRVVTGVGTSDQFMGAAVRVVRRGGDGVWRTVDADQQALVLAKAAVLCALGIVMWIPATNDSLVDKCPTCGNHWLSYGDDPKTSIFAKQCPNEWHFPTG